MEVEERKGREPSKTGALWGWRKISGILEIDLMTIFSLHRGKAFQNLTLSTSSLSRVGSYSLPQTWVIKPTLLISRWGLFIPAAEILRVRSPITRESWAFWPTTPLFPKPWGTISSFCRREDKKSRSRFQKRKEKVFSPRSADRAQWNRLRASSGLPFHRYSFHISRLLPFSPHFPPKYSVFSSW